MLDSGYTDNSASFLGFFFFWSVFVPCYVTTLGLFFMAQSELPALTPALWHRAAQQTSWLQVSWAYKACEVQSLDSFLEIQKKKKKKSLPHNLLVDELF